MREAGRWLPEGVGVERLPDGRVRIIGGEHDGHVFAHLTELQEFARQLTDTTSGRPD